LGRFAEDAAREWLRRRQEIEPDPEVQREITAALAAVPAAEGRRA
jgi:hypothetical protein